MEANSFSQIRHALVFGDSDKKSRIVTIDWAGVLSGLNDLKLLINPVMRLVYEGLVAFSAFRNSRAGADVVCGTVKALETDGLSI